jgi:hypothetical protein
VAKPEIAVSERSKSALKLRNADVRNIKTWEEAAALFDEAGVVDASILGDGFQILRRKDKDQLIGKAFLILDFKEIEGDFGGFVTLRVVTKANEKFRLSDGSTGIYTQLMEIREETGREGGIVVKNGLTRSDYTYTDPSDNSEKPAYTYYLDISG